VSVRGGERQRGRAAVSGLDRLVRLGSVPSSTPAPGRASAAPGRGNLPPAWPRPASR
jgi:hypothetical protein